MIQEFIIAVIKAGLPVALASYALVWWALKQGYLDGAAGVQDAVKEVKRLSRTQSGRKRKNAEAAENTGPLNNLVHNKWLAFGGGFYGVVALVTYAVVEMGEIWDFVARYDGLAGLLAHLNPGMIIELIIDAVTNFVVAIAWPVYWMGDLAGEYLWVWLAVAYGGYWLGVRYALHRSRQ